MKETLPCVNCSKSNRGSECGFKSCVYFKGWFSRNWITICKDVKKSIKLKRSGKGKSHNQIKFKKIDKSLAEILQELDRYNKDHGTLLTYGQYVVKMKY